MKPLFGKVPIPLVLLRRKGFSERNTFVHIFKIMWIHKPSLVYLVETRANSEHIDRFLSKFPHSWDWAAIEVDGFSGCFSGPTNNVFNGDLIALDVALHFTLEEEHSDQACLHQ
ncbi:uncharacterized protein LOC120271948 isoform X3 [Dioscorea cayenensis subsp. rotundata]|uniref:Uncharacterized protein LOC120271948 isoform X3 n=1 Tax=Dioscorea cayennensis subsp. rotundata TaxID=55577 RepID=A0AB40C6L5_DIOCR|nr:uncharacterized protein LOC120271948 isoform X3 [Dioscorea cayenensis subsp. rotundata]